MSSGPLLSRLRGMFLLIGAIALVSPTASEGDSKLTFRRNPGTGGVPETIFNFVFSGYLERLNDTGSLKLAGA